MVSVIIITKYGQVTSKNINGKNIQDNILNKGEKSSYKILNIWEENDCDIVLFGYSKGSHNNINPCELPPPVDNEIYYGDLILYKIKNNELIDFETLDYFNWYNNKFGGFENLSDTYEEDEIEDDDEYDLTDGFVVEG